MKKKIIKKTVIISVLLLLMLPVAAYTAESKNEAKHSEQGFNDIKKWVEIFEDPERDKWQKPVEVVKKLKIKNGDIIADIGAGTGYFTRHFARAVAPDGKAIGLDIELSMVNDMKEDAKKLGLKNYEAMIVKVDDPGLQPVSIDVVFLCNTYHHIESRIDYFKKVSKSLKKNGRVIIVDFYKKPLPVGPPSVDHKLSRDAVLKEMSEAGYNVLKEHDFLQYQYFIEFGFRP